MHRASIDQLLAQLRKGEVDRRGFVKAATALGISAGAAGSLASTVAAQDATPPATPEATPEEATPAATGMAMTSITRAEYMGELDEAFDFEEPQQMGGQLIQTETTDISTLNALISGDTLSSRIAGFCFHTLVSGSVIDGQPVPNLADYWELSDDGLTYTFYLPENAMWHDGTPLTAHDVVFSFDSTLAEDSLSVRRSSVDAVLESYQALDDYTFEMTAVDTLANFIPDSTNLVYILPQHIWEDVPLPEWGSDPGATGTDPERVVGSGPFRFVQWAQNDNVTIERNEDFWRPDEAANIDQYIYQVVGEATTAISALQTGETDVVEVPSAQVDPLAQSNPEINIQTFDTLSFNFYIPNQDEASTDLFTDVRVRQALHYALDRELIAEQVYQGYALQADGTQPVLSPAYAPDRIDTIYNFDPDLATELFEEAGWTPGDDGVLVNEAGDRFSFECIYAESSAEYETQVPYMQQAWGEVGVEMIPSALPFPTVIDQTDASNFEMAILGFNWSADPGQGTMFRCDSVPPAGFNMMRYCNEEYDELDEQQARELDLDARIDILLEQSNIVNDEMAVGINVFRQDTDAASPRVHNYLPSGYSRVWWLTRAWLSDF